MKRSVTQCETTFSARKVMADKKKFKIIKKKLREKG